MKERLEKIVAEGLESLFGLRDVSFVVEHPKELSHGDYATNAALVAFKGRRKFEEALDGNSETVNIQYGIGTTNQIQFAEKLVDYINKHKGEEIESISIAGPGFINIKLTRETFVGEIKKVLLEKETWGHTEVYTGKKILVEHSSPNLFKPFHIGHLMNNTIGEAIARLASVSGADVKKISFPSDISLGVAKAIFVLLESYGPDYIPSDIAVLGDAYVAGVQRYEDDENIHGRIKEIADNLYGGVDSPELKLFEAAKNFNITYFETIVAKLGSSFDEYIYESEAGIEGKKIVLDNTPDIFTKSDGAIVYTPGNKLHTAVFINSQGNPTYEAKDIGLLDLKFKRYSPDLSIFITDAQQISHFAVVLDAAAKIHTEWAENSLHRYHGRMSFKGQKMSSRLGGVPIVEDVLAAVTDEVTEKNPDVSPESAEAIGNAAIKFAILRAAAGKDIDFDPDTSLSFEGDSGPYLQYTAVRACSLLSKGGTAGITPDSEISVEGTEILERLIARFPEVVKSAQLEWMPHYLVTYLCELAQAFNSWYGQGKIINEDKSATAYRLAIVDALRQTLVNGLWILGIKVPEKM